MKVIEADNLSKHYGTFTALDQVSFSVEQGEIIGLLGPNGAGKTTLMKALAGYHQPDAGNIHISGVDVVAQPEKAQIHIGYLPESAPLYREMAVQEYLLMMAALRECPKDKEQEWLSEAIYATGLEDFLTKPIGTLSKGYRQRVGIAQAILHKPELLILDEPTTGLDPNQIVEIRQLIGRLAEHSTVMLSTHILSEVEMSCKRALIIIGGQLRADASIDELRASNTAFVSIETSATGVRKALEGIDDVTSVTEQAKVGDYQSWRVMSSSPDDLCPAIFKVVQEKNWRISELRSAPRTLESVFRELADNPSASEPLSLAS